MNGNRAVVVRAHLRIMHHHSCFVPDHHLSVHPPTTRNHRQPETSNPKRGFTLLELLAILVVIVVLAGIYLSVPKRTGDGGRSMKDGAQIRGIVQSMAIWANNNNGSYPLPSVHDPDGLTTGVSGHSLDTTDNLLSILVYNGFLSTELLVSPAERSGSIEVDPDYENSEPKAAADPLKALWDPALSVDFVNGMGNTSYAHLMPDDARIGAWKDTFSSQECVLGNRGPEVLSVDRTKFGALRSMRADPKSITHQIHGGPSTWEGHMGFNDGRVTFLTEMNPETMYGDVLFALEADGHTWPGIDHYLGIFTSAGDEPADFTAIWD